MCGIVVLAGHVPAPLVAQAIQGAGARGPHTHGWAFRDGDGWTVLRYPGRLVYETFPALLRTRALPPGVLYIGHSRLATSGARAGDAPPLQESQPYVESGRYLIAHNGTIPDEVSGRKPRDVDTKMLLRGLEAGVAPVGMLARAGRPQAAVWAVDEAIFACRIDGEKLPAHPLYSVRGRGWLVVSSGLLPEGKLLKSGRAIQLH